jgi:hypothetical protein
VNDGPIMPGADAHQPLTRVLFLGSQGKQSATWRMLSALCGERYAVACVGSESDTEDAQGPSFFSLSSAQRVTALGRKLAVCDVLLHEGHEEDVEAALRASHLPPVVVDARRSRDVLSDMKSASGRRPAPAPSLFRSFLQGGFECSTHHRPCGHRLDLIAATGHDKNVDADYRAAAAHGLTTLRDGLRWHLIEAQPGRWDLSSVWPMFEAAASADAQVIWDLMHYGWPDDLDIWKPAFVDRFARYARTVARVFRETSDATPWWCPINEISYMAWAGGEEALHDPFTRGRGFELKVQLARASIAAMVELKSVDARARFVHCEPMMAIHHDPTSGSPLADAAGWHEAQYQAFDLISGRLWPQIGGDRSFLDVIGVNYYPWNQRLHGGPVIGADHPSHQPPGELLLENFARYGRPLLIAETSTEGHERAAWFRMIHREAMRARARGAPVEGICIYPIIDHPGWTDDRLCRNGLFGLDVEDGRREIHFPLAEAIRETSATWRRRAGRGGPGDEQEAPPGEGRRGGRARAQAFMPTG